MATKKKVEAEAKPEVIVSFKGFDAQLRCRGFQYEIGATYTHAGKVVACPTPEQAARGEGGFHACADPFDVLNYYPLLTEQAKPNRFGIVEQSGEIARHSEDSKIASASITITAELSLPDFVKRAVTWMLDHVSKDAKVEGAEVASGHSSKLAASGHSSQLAASGHYSKLAASGDSSQLAASGDSSQLAASGDSSKLAASGENSVIASSSYNGIAKGAAGTWIALAEYNSDGKCVGFATGCIGQDGLEPDTYYCASGRKLVKA